MATRAPQGKPVKPVKNTPQVPRWSLLSRVAFRFCFVYFALYGFVTPIVGGLILLPNFSFPNLGTLWPMRQITFWVASHVFGVTSPLVYAGNSGDTTFHWVQTFWLLVFSALASALWSWLDRGQEHYIALHKWFRLFVRFGLAAQMFYYGLAKVIPTQFPPPSLVTLVEPVGHLSRTDLLWTFIGASTAYQIFTGAAEVLGGLLLVVPRTTMLGALICMADMIQVFVLNMTYDFGLKLISFHLILMSLILLAPDLRRLANTFVLDRAVGPASHPPLFRTRRANRLALALQILFAVYLMGMFTRLALNYWSAAGGGGSPKSALYGIWDVEQLSIDGQVRSPLLNDYDRRWRRVIFDAPNRIVFQRTDDSFAHYGVSIDVNGQSIALTKGNSRSWQATFAFRRPAAGHLILDGDMDQYRIHMELQLVEFDTFRLLNSGFRWIRPPDPYGG
jgi:uncharacterized membrane protein YphA (DoxX/SURF4 family)